MTEAEWEVHKLELAIRSRQEGLLTMARSSRRQWWRRKRNQSIWIASQQMLGEIETLTATALLKRGWASG